MEIAERIENRMKQYGFKTLDEMLKAIEQQEPIDVSIFVMPGEEGGVYEQSIKLA